MAPLPAVVLQSSGDEFELFVLLLVGFVGGLYLVYDGFDTWKMARLIQDTPTAKVRSMAVGRTELEGTIREHESFVRPPYTDQKCIYVSWEAERRERHRDEDGNVHYTWDTVADGRESLAFVLEDNTGKVLVRADLDDPEFDVQTSEFSRTVYFDHGEMPPNELGDYILGYRERRDARDEADDDGFLGKAFESVTEFMEKDNPLTDTSRRRRYTQTILPIGTDIYLFGSAEPKQGGRMETSEADLLEIRRDTGTDEFLIADSDEERLQERYSRMGPLKTIGGLALSAISLYFLLSWYLMPTAV